MNERINPLQVSDAALDSELSDYLVVRKLRTGPFGNVFKGLHQKLQKVVSIRILPIPANDFPGGGSAFLSYMAGYAQFQHPLLAEISDFGETESGILYVVTNSAENTVLSEGARTVEQVDSIFKQLLEALGWLHQNGVVHGWIHTDLIGVDDSGGLKLEGVGFAGLAETVGPHLDLSSISPFLAPENSGGKVATEASGDFYATGACLYQALTGALPQGIFQLPSDVNPGIEKRFDTALIQALQASPEKRFPDAQSFLSALENSAASKPPSRPAPKKVVLTPSARPALATGSAADAASAQRKPHQPPLPTTPQKSFPWVIVVPVMLVVVVGAIFVISQVGKPTATKPPVKPGIGGNDKKEKEEEDVKLPRRRGEIDHGRLAEISLKLMELRQLATHCPNLQEEADKSEMLKLLIVASGYLEDFVRESNDEELTEFLMSDKLLESVSVSLENSRLPKPQIPNRSGALVAWTSERNSEKEASEILTKFTGPTTGIVALAGDIEEGIALSKTGELATWGEDSAVPESIKNVVSIDCENGSFAALTKAGAVKVWGNETIENADLSNWENISGIAVGDGHVVGVTENFEVFAAGASDAGQTEVPKEVKKYKIVAVEAVENRSYALASNGYFFTWGGNVRSNRVTLPLPSAMQSSGKKVYVQMRDGSITSIDSNGARNKEDFGSEIDDVYIPRFSPNQKVFAFHRGGSHWTVSNEGDATINVLLGASKFIAISPQVPIPPTKPTMGVITTSTTGTEYTVTIPSLTETSRKKSPAETAKIDVSLPETDSQKDSSEKLHHDEFDWLSKTGDPLTEWNSTRQWRAKDGRILQAKILSVNDGIGTFFTSKKQTVEIPISRLTDEDASFIRGWEVLSDFFNLDWEPSRRFDDTIEAGVADGNFANAGKVHESRNFRFECDVNLTRLVVRDFIRLFEATYNAVEENPLALALAPSRDGKFLVRLFSDQSDYYAAGGAEDSAGIYLLKERCILVPLSSLGFEKGDNGKWRKSREYDPATLIHETTHAITHQWLEFMPMWFIEGYAEYMAAVPFRNDALDFGALDEGIEKRLEKKFHRNLSNFTPVETNVLVALSHGDFMGNSAMSEKPIELERVLPHILRLKNGNNTLSNTLTIRSAPNLTLPPPITIVRLGPDYTITSRYASSMLLVKQFFDSAQPESLRKYLYAVLAGQWERDAYLAKYQQVLRAHTEKVNAQIVAFNKEIERYNDEVRLYNQDNASGEPVEPNIPEPVAVPEILDNPWSAHRLSTRRILQEAALKHLQNGLDEK